MTKRSVERHAKTHGALDTQLDVLGAGYTLRPQPAGLPRKGVVNRIDQVSRTFLQHPDRHLSYCLHEVIEQLKGFVAGSGALGDLYAGNDVGRHKVVGET